MTRAEQINALCDKIQGLEDALANPAENITFADGSRLQYRSRHELTKALNDSRKQLTTLQGTSTTSSFTRRITARTR